MKKSQLRKVIREVIKEQFGDMFGGGSACWDPCAINGVAPGGAGQQSTSIGDCSGQTSQGYQVQTGDLTQGVPVMQIINMVFGSINTPGVQDAWCSGNFNLEGMSLSGPDWSTGAMYSNSTGPYAYSGPDFSCCEYPEGYPQSWGDTSTPEDTFTKPPKNPPNTSPVGSGPTGGS